MLAVVLGNSKDSTHINETTTAIIALFFIGLAHASSVGIAFFQRHQHVFLLHSLFMSVPSYALIEYPTQTSQAIHHNQLNCLVQHTPKHFRSRSIPFVRAPGRLHRSAERVYLDTRWCSGSDLPRTRILGESFSVGRYTLVE